MRKVLVCDWTGRQPSRCPVAGPELRPRNGGMGGKEKSPSDFWSGRGEHGIWTGLANWTFRWSCWLGVAVLIGRGIVGSFWLGNVVGVVCFVGEDCWKW